MAAPLRARSADEVGTDLGRDLARHVGVEGVELAVAEGVASAAPGLPDVDYREAQHAEDRMGGAALGPLVDAGLELVGFEDRAVEGSICAHEDGALALGLGFGDQHVNDVVPEGFLIGGDGEKLELACGVDEAELEEIDARRDEVLCGPRAEDGPLGPRVDRVSRDLGRLDPPQDLVADDTRLGWLRRHAPRGWRIQVGVSLLQSRSREVERRECVRVGGGSAASIWIRGRGNSMDGSLTPMLSPRGVRPAWEAPATSKGVTVWCMK